MSLFVTALPHGSHRSPVRIACKVYPSTYREDPDPNPMYRANWERSLFLGINTFPKVGTSWGVGSAKEAY